MQPLEENQVSLLADFRQHSLTVGALAGRTSTDSEVIGTDCAQLGGLRGLWEASLAGRGEGVLRSDRTDTRKKERASARNKQKHCAEREYVGSRRIVSFFFLGQHRKRDETWGLTT